MEISVTELNEKLKNNAQDVFLLDVRDEKEYEIANIGGHLIPMNTIESRISEIDFSKQVIVICHHGIRSKMVAEQLRALGHENVYSLKGGVDSWSQEIDNTMPRY